jgi:hypothetical protein
MPEADAAGKIWQQWRPEARNKLWALTHKWADAILYGGWQVNVGKYDKANGKEPGVGNLFRARPPGVLGR